MHYDEKLPLLLVCDASPFGVGAVLLQNTNWGRKLIEFASQASEHKYSKLDKEALTLILGV